MKLSDISCLCDSLCYVLDCNNLSVHLLAVSQGSLLLVFCYCFNDYLSKFKLTSKQLICLADINICTILSLRDISSRFVYNNIQNYKVNVFCIYVGIDILIYNTIFLNQILPNRRRLMDSRSLSHRSKCTLFYCLVLQFSHD